MKIVRQGNLRKEDDTREVLGDREDREEGGK